MDKIKTISNKDEPQIKQLLENIFNINNKDNVDEHFLNIINFLCRINNLQEINQDDLTIEYLTRDEKGIFIPPNKFTFNQTFLEYNFSKDDFQLNGNSLEQNQRFLKYCLILNILHEFRHYQQYYLNKDKNNEIINGLNVPLSETPLYLFQEHEIDAFNTSFDVAESFKDLFDDDFLDYIKQEKNNFLTQQKEDKKKFSEKPKKLIQEVRPFYEDYLTLQDFELGKNPENIQSDNIRFNLDNQSYNLNLYKTQDNEFLCKLTNETAANSSIYFKINFNQLSILNFTQGFNGLFYEVDNDTKKSLTAAVLQIVNYLKHQSQLETSRQNIIVNKIMPIEPQSAIKEFINSLSQIDNIKVSNSFSFINKTHYVSYPIEDKIKESIKECMVINNIRNIFKKIQDNTISENDININDLNKMVEMQNQRSTFNFSNIPTSDIIKMFKMEIDKQISRSGKFDFSDTNIKNIFFISKLQNLQKEIMKNKNIIDQETILNEQKDEEKQKINQQNKENLDR